MGVKQSIGHGNDRDRDRLRIGLRNERRAVRGGMDASGLRASPVHDVVERQTFDCVVHHEDSKQHVAEANQIHIIRHLLQIRQPAIRRARHTVEKRRRPAAVFLHTE
jgi:hypothetical protein